MALAFATQATQASVGPKILNGSQKPGSEVGMSPCSTGADTLLRRKTVASTGLSIICVIAK